MAGPWEKYAPASETETKKEGPWTKYGKPKEEEPGAFKRFTKALGEGNPLSQREAPEGRKEPMSFGEAAADLPATAMREAGNMVMAPINLAGEFISDPASAFGHLVGAGTQPGRPLAPGATATMRSPVRVADKSVLPKLPTWAHAYPLIKLLEGHPLPAAASAGYEGLYQAGKLRPQLPYEVTEGPPVGRTTPPIWEGKTAAQPPSAGPPVEPIPATETPGGRAPGRTTPQRQRTPAWQTVPPVPESNLPEFKPVPAEETPQGRAPGRTTPRPERPARPEPAWRKEVPEVPPPTTKEFSSVPAEKSLSGRRPGSAAAAEFDEPVTQKPGKLEGGTQVQRPGKFWPRNVATDDGVQAYANENGIDVDQARSQLKDMGFEVTNKTTMNRMVHGAADDLKWSHRALSDVAKERYGVNSMTEMTGAQQLDLYHHLLNQLETPKVPR